MACTSWETPKWVEKAVVEEIQRRHDKALGCRECGSLRVHYDMDKYNYVCRDCGRNLTLREKMDIQGQTMDATWVDEIPSRDLGAPVALYAKLEKEIGERPSALRQGIQRIGRRMQRIGRRALFHKT